MIRIDIVRTCAVLALAACCVSDVDAQEVSVFSVLSTSTQPTLAESGGFGVAGVVAGSQWLRLEASFTTVSSDSRRAAFVCGSYIPPGNCGDEELSEEYLLRSYRVAFAPLILDRPAVDLALKAGLSMSQIVSESRTESIRMTNLQHSRTGQDGRFVGAQLSVRPLRRVPLALQLGGLRQWVDFDACQEYHFQYAPFCGVDTFDELQIGAAIVLKR